MDVAVESVDGDLMPVAEARKHARNYFYAGFAFLPLFWAVNAWLFWPAAAPGAGAAAAADPIVRKYTRYSAACFAAASAALTAWTLTFAVGGPAAVGARVYGALDVTNLDIWGSLTGGA